MFFKSRFSIVFSLFGAIFLIISFVVPIFSNSFYSVLNKQEQSWLENNSDKLNLKYNTIFPPIEFSDQNGLFCGIGADVIELVEKKLGFRISKNIASSWEQHLGDLKKGTCTIAPVIAANSLRRDYILYTRPYISIPVVIITTEKFGNNLSIKDFKNKHFAAIKEYASKEYLETKSEAGFDIKVVEDAPQGLRAVAFGQVDALIVNLATASYFISELGISNLKVAAVTDFTIDLCIGVSDKYPEFFRILNKAYSAITEKELETFRNRWIKLKIEKGFSSRTLYYFKTGFIFLATLIIFLVLITLFLKKKLREKMENLLIVNAKIIENEKRYLSFFKNAPLPFVDISINDSRIIVNRAFTETFGYTNEDVPDIDIWWIKAYPDFLYREKVKKEWVQAVDKLIKNSDLVLKGEYKIACKSGQVVDIMISINRCEERLLVSFFDLSSIGHTRLELKKSLKRFEKLFDLLPFPCIISDFTDKFLMVNKTVCGIMGLQPENLIGRSYEELGLKFIFKDPEYNDPEYFYNAISNEKSFFGQEVEILFRNSKLSVLYFGILIDWCGQKAILGATVDITERKQAEYSLKMSEENLRITMNAIADAVISTNINGEITAINPVAQKLTGFYETTAIGINISKVLLSEHDILGEDPVAKTVSTGQTINLPEDFLLISKKGSRILIQGTSSPIFKTENEIVGVVLVFRDITEEQEIKERLLQSRKMDAIGQLAGGIAHDFNNMLVGMMGAAELLELELEETDQNNEILSILIESAQKASDLTNNLLSFARKQPALFSRIPINKPINDAVKLYTRTMDKRITLSLNLLEEECLINGSSAQLQTSFLNLFINAGHAMPGGGDINIMTERKQLDSFCCVEPPITIKSGDYIMVQISDTGFGIPPKNLKKVFEPFFTTKEAGRGTGLGLSAVLGTIQQHNGCINVNSKPGKGTIFQIFLPIAENCSYVKNVEDSLFDYKGSGTILIIDDEEIMREVASAILKKIGYQIVFAENGKTGIDIFIEKKDEIDLVLLDMIMPEKNGRDCFYEMRKIKPDLKVILTSGFTRKNEIGQMVENGLQGFIQKPFRSADLGKIVQTVLSDTQENDFFTA